MLWVCRPGVNAFYYEYFLVTQKIFMAWEGYKTDLSVLQTREQFRQLVIVEKGDVPRTSISNWSGQLYTFCREMAVGDYVLVPSKGSHTYTLARIDGEYEYNPQDDKMLWHSRKIKILMNNIPRNIFSQSLQYSLGAYRTVFKIKNDVELLLTIKQYKARKKYEKNG